MNRKKEAERLRIRGQFAVGEFYFVVPEKIIGLSTFLRIKIDPNRLFPKTKKLLS